ncbi:MAG TPA: FAD-dependent oxidoreductase [Methanospirillum sp.]|uniref:protoporphyrinogen/coproporphyrinogen oxidase n=1 Tax=Methanospirillum sp. TaxID=45200 RepID=UPI002CF6F904|nr:FAD-dependent oxidoreductase [Methanospirillum sp.]HWQ63325.1 FAD-dependent oxidoreductase [Methanospirillum sp.]
MKTVIIGGGLAGVTLAHLLSKEGEEVLVLEKDSSIGGLCKSITTDGFTFDIGGSHIIFSRDQEVLSFMHQVLKENRGERKRDTKIFYKNRYIKYPFENGLYELPKEDCYTCLNEFIKTLIALEKGELKDPENFRDWIYHTFGKGIAEAYLVPYNEKIWNYPLNQISAHWVEGRVPRPPVEDIIKAAVGVETEGYAHQAIFSYPITGGIEALIEAIARPVTDRIRTGFNVTSIQKTEDGWEVSNGTDIIRADKLISTLPLQILQSCFSSLPDPVRTAINALKYNSIVCVGIGLNGQTLPFSWMYLPEKEGTAANRISFPSNFSTEVAPDGCSSILAEITYNAGDRIDQMSDAEIVRDTINALGTAKILDPDQVRSALAVRHRFAYVVYDLAWQQNMKIIKEHFASVDISLVGRFSQFEYLNMDGVIRSVMDFVRGL